MRTNDRRRSSNRRLTVVIALTLGLLAVVPVTAALRPSTASAAVALPGDGTTAATAGASASLPPPAIASASS